MRWPRVPRPGLPRSVGTRLARVASALPGRIAGLPGVTALRQVRLVVLAAALAVTAGGGIAYVVTVAVATPSAVTSPVRPSPARTPVLAPLATAPPPATAAVTAALAGAERNRGFGGSLAGLVVDAHTGARLFARDATASMPPASTAKLLTATAALEALGPSATLSTRVVRAGDTLYLVGGGDVTLTATATGDYPRPATLDDLASRTAAALRTTTANPTPDGTTPDGTTPDGTTPVRLRYDVTAWSGPASAPGWSPRYFTEGDVSRLSPLEVDEGRVQPDGPARVADPAGVAARRFATALQQAGVRVAGPVEPGTAPSSALDVADVSSPPLSELVIRLLTWSDNDLAEALGRAVAAHDGQPPDFDGAAAAVTARVRALGVPLDGVVLHDASGLSRRDRVTPTALVTVLRIAAQRAHPELRPVLEGLPVGGVTGTLADRYRHAPSRAAGGVLRAKTGNLIGVNTLAGEVVDADGELLLFAFLTADAPSPDAGEAALDRLAARLALCGCH